MSAALKPDYDILWAPQAGPQKAYFDCPLAEILFGGSRGGGKSDGILGKWAAKAERYGVGFNAVFFRQEMPQQDDLTERGKELFMPLGAEWVEYKKTFNFAGGGRLRFRPLESIADANKYQGQNLSDGAVEEAGNYPSSAPIDMLHGAMRSVRGVPVQLTLTANPGGSGHQWIKRRYIDPAPLGMKILKRLLPNGAEHRYIYIPSRVQDNRALLARDPTYINRLHLVGSEALVKAWLTGDWNVVAGAFFDCWDGGKHVIRPFAIPAHWVRFGSFDWGSARPFSMQWWAISDGSTLPDGRQYPTGAMILYREWYGASGPNEGLRMTTGDIAAGIKAREAEDPKIDFRVADPACWKVDGGPSHAEIMMRQGVTFRPADNSRIAGWTQMRDRLIGQDGIPMIYVFTTALDFIRTVPALQHDDIRPEDVDSSAEDHCFGAGTMVAGEFGPIKIEEMPPTGHVYGPDGRLHAYHGCGRKQRAARVVKLLFADDVAVTCTPDHEFLTEDGRWTQAADMVDEYGYRGMIPLCKTLSSYPGQSKSSKAFATIYAASISSTKGGASMSRYGKRLMALCRLGIMSTTTAMIARITGLKNCCVSPALTISNCMAPNPQREQCNTFRWLARLPRRGTEAKPAANGIGSTGMKALGRVLRSASNWCASVVQSHIQQPALAGITGAFVPGRASRHGAAMLGWTMWSASALNAGQPSSSIATPKQRLARGCAEGQFPAASGLACRSVGNAGVADVYCLTVPDTGSFMLANGLAVSNCGDSGRYACMSRPWTRKPSVVTPMRGLDSMTMAEAWKLGSPKRGGGRI